MFQANMRHMAHNTMSSKNINTNIIKSVLGRQTKSYSEKTALQIWLLVANISRKRICQQNCDCEHSWLLRSAIAPHFITYFLIFWWFIVLKEIIILFWSSLKNTYLTLLQTQSCSCNRNGFGMHIFNTHTHTHTFSKKTENFA